MKILITVLAVALATATAAIPATGFAQMQNGHMQPDTMHNNSTLNRGDMNHGDMDHHDMDHGHMGAMGHHLRHCHMIWRHHHHVRVCR